MPPAIDLTNTRFGNLVAIAPTDRRDKCGKIFWQCRCDCGRNTEVVGSALKNGTSRSCQKGECHYLWQGKDANSNAIHTWLSRHATKTGRCEQCGKEEKTHHAFLRHPAPHTRDLADYRELCIACHNEFDSHPRDEKTGRFTPKSH